VLSAAFLRGNGVIHRTQKVIQVDDNGHVGCGNIFCGKILVPVNDRVFAKNVSQIFRRGQIRAYLSGARRAEKSGKQIPFLRTNLKKAFFKFEPI
jgi:hypothetical protein